MFFGVFCCFIFFVISTSVVGLVGCSCTGKKRLEKKCKQPKALILQYLDKTKDGKSIVFLPICGGTVLPTVCSKTCWRNW